MWHELLVNVGQRAVFAVPYYLLACSIIGLLAYLWPFGVRRR